MIVLCSNPDKQYGILVITQPLTKVYFLEIKPQINTDELSVFICGSLFLLIPIQLMIATNPLVETLHCNVSTWSICHILFLNWYYSHFVISLLTSPTIISKLGTQR